MQGIENLKPKPGHFLFTSEAVTVGHPDKLCDYISDSVLDACLAVDPDSKVACESAVKNSICMVFGEVSTKAELNVEQIVRKAIKEVGYEEQEYGMDYKTATVIVALDKQSGEIAKAVHLNKKEEEMGAGDQGLMFGYATDESEDLMPLTMFFCNKLVRRMEHCFKAKELDWIRPDGKVQVTVEYKQEGRIITPVRVHTILISTQHDRNVTNERIHADLTEKVIKVVVPERWLINTRLILNPSGSFYVGGPAGDAGMTSDVGMLRDAGLTGRKIIVDTYGGWGGHGGGAFSGKDPSKVDRSAAYAARWVAKSLVHSKLCRRVLVQVAYSIGIPEPLSLFVDTYDTAAPGTEEDSGLNDEKIQEIVVRNFDMRLGSMIRDLDLKRPIYRETASGGHFGRDNKKFTWEVPKDLSHEVPKA